MLSRLLPSLVLILLLLAPLPLSAQDRDRAGEDEGEIGWQFLGAPYINADSDNGIVFGVASGIAHPPHTAYIINSSYATKGLAGITWRGETGTDKWRHLFMTRLWLMPANLYPATGASPDAYASARLQHTEFQIATMRRFTPHLEIGPELWTDFAKGIDPEDADEAPLDVNTLPRFQDGSLILFGLRGRYRTTSAVRPTNGAIVDLALRTGRADGIEWEAPRHTNTADLWLAMAKPLTANSRLYLRGWFRVQDEVAHSVRNALGGIYTLRGQPFNRDYGRRLLAGRLQYHITLAQDVTLVSDFVQKVLPFMPTWRLGFEAVPFADIGAVGDPEWGGFRQTRQGYGLGFRIVLPPELVFSIDLALSPDGSMLYYFGGGESL